MSPGFQFARRPARVWRGVASAIWLLGLAFGVANTGRAQAVWDGGAGTGNWATANNWNPNSVPGNTATLTFDGANAGGQYTITLGGANRTTAGITFANATGANAFTFSVGNTLIVNAGGITNNDADTQTFNVLVQVGAAQTWNASAGDLVFNAVNLNANLTLSGSNDITLGNSGGSLTLNNNRTLTNNATGAVTVGPINLSNRTLTATGTGTTSVTGVVSGSGSILKSGTGTLRLSGTNTYTGSTTISQGTIIVDANAPSGSAGALGNSTGAITLNNASTGANNTALLIGTSGVTVGRAVTVANSGSGTPTIGGNITTGTGTFTGNITLNKTTQFNADGTSTITFQTGTFSGTGGVTKTGDGTVVFAGAKGYSGTTTVNEGTLRAESNAGALGTGTLTLAGGELELANNSGLSFNRNTTITGNATVTSDRLATGAGVTHTLGTLSIGSNTLTVEAGGNVTSGTAGITFGATTTTGNATFNVGSGALLTLGALSDGGSADTITKSGAGTLTLATAAGTITNGTAFNATAGTTNLNNATALGSLTNVTLSTGATVNLGASQTFGALNGTGGTLNLNANTLTVGSTNNLSGTYGGAIQGTGNLVKAGTGTLTLTSNNTYSGTTTVNAGALNLQANAAAGTGTITVGANGTLQVQGGGVNVANNITLAGGTLQSVSGDGNQFSGNITLSSPSSIVSSTAGQTLIVGDFISPGVTTDLALGANTLTVSGAGNIDFYANVGLSGNTGGFVSNSTGTVRFYGYTNYYQGNTTINSGTLLLDTDPNSIYNNQTIRGNLTIGDGVNAATVRFANDSLDNRIADTSTITINQGSTFDLNNNFDTVGALNLTGATVSLGAEGTLQLTGDVTVNAGTSTISGYQFSMTTDNTTRNFNVANGGTLNVSAQMTTGSLVKQGEGTMILTGNNIYTGTTTVSNGVLDIRSNTALGSTIGGTTVASGGELRLNNASGLTITGEALTLNGVGDTGPTGALRNVAGDNTWAGSVTLGSAARINADSGTLLTVSGGVILGGNNLTVGGVGNTTISGVISNGSGTGTLTKDGTGTLTLTGNNNYSGVTTISEGVVNVRNDYGLGTTGAGTTVATGAALQLQGNISVGAESLSLSGTGVSNDGALRNISGNNSYGGAITVATASTRINSDSGTLTLGGTIATGSNTLTVGGSGNVTHTGQLTGTASSNLVKDGSGTLTLSNSTNTFAGNVSVDAGTLAFGANNALNNTAIDVSIASGATMSLVQYAQTIGTLAGLGALDFGTSGSLTLTGNTTFSGSFAGTGTLIVSSGVTLTLGADFNAAGVTIVLAGGTLDVNGSNSVFAGLSLTDNSIIDFDAGQDSIIRFGSLSLGSYTLAVYGWTDTQDYFYSTAAPGTQGNPPLNQITFGPSGGPPWTGENTTWIPFDQQVTPVPEPSTYGAMLMGAGLVFFGYRRWRQQRAAAKK